MKTGVFDSKKIFHEIPFYEIQGLMSEISKKAIELKPEYKKTFEKYKKNITRFSKELEFVLHELGWYIYDPFCHGEDEVLFSNGKRTYLASVSYIMKPDFDRKNIADDTIGYPLLTDEIVGYDRELNYKNIDEGVVDSNGYVDCKFAGGLEELAEIELLHELIQNKAEYENYINTNHEYNSKLEYLTNKPNTMVARKQNDGTISLLFVSENDGVVKEFVDRLKEEEKISELIPIVGEESIKTKTA